MSATQQVLETARSYHRDYRFDEALVLYQSLYKLDDRSPELLFLMGLAHYQKQNFKLAERFLRKAVAAAPGHCESHCVLGQTLLHRGRLSEARRSFDAGRAADDQNLAAINGGVIACYLLGEFAEAERRLHKSVMKNGSEADAWFNLSRTYKDVFPVHVAMLDPRTPRFVLVNLLYNDRAFATAADAVLDRALDDAGVALRAGRCQVLIRHPLFNHILETTLVPVAEFERLLVRLRRMLLEYRLHDAGEATPPKGIWPFAARLAAYFWRAEYLPGETDSERQGVQRLQSRLATEEPLDYPDRLLIVAYQAPDEPMFAATEPPSFVKPLVSIAAERAEERRIAAELPALTPIEDPVSARVRDQYEAFPYPRWQAAAVAGEKISFGDALRGVNPDAVFDDFLFKPVKLLVAGCGTGQEPINYARSYLIERLLAIDLSRTSLAYATRKARELGLDTIEFAQADILALEPPAEPFDLICSSGVLHHLRDPVQGWSVLRSMLRRGGIMLIALYSRAARRLIVRGREMAAQSGLTGELRDMRRLRQAVFEQPDHELHQLQHWNDFYTASMCRDLLFHEQEHQFDVPQIGACLRALDLEFLGFAGLTLEARQRYIDVHGSAGGVTELAGWKAVEQAYPDTFTGMYQLILRG
jgi:SAM-dependent methyltransferase/tetratricopeptide (TPR) repeat protein